MNNAETNLQENFKLFKKLSLAILIAYLLAFIMILTTLILSFAIDLSMVYIRILVCISCVLIIVSSAVELYINKQIKKRSFNTILTMLVALVVGIGIFFVQL